MEVRTFHLVWVTAAFHAAWREQGLLVAPGCITVVLLNAVTTADPLPVALLRGPWQSAGVDLILLAIAAIAAGAARTIGRFGKNRAARRQQGTLADA